MRVIAAGQKAKEIALLPEMTLILSYWAEIQVLKEKVLRKKSVRMPWKPSF
ncbi:hypothetical protein D3C80_2047770 [compost metagenome]